jgi:hypothetical protein
VINSANSSDTFLREADRIMGTVLVNMLILNLDMNTVTPRYTLNSYSRGVRFESRPGRRICWLMFFRAFPHSLEANAGPVSWLHHELFLPNSFNSSFTYRPFEAIQSSY